MFINNFSLCLLPLLLVHFVSYACMIRLSLCIRLNWKTSSAKQNTYRRNVEKKIHYKLHHHQQQQQKNSNWVWILRNGHENYYYFFAAYFLCRLVCFLNCYWLFEKGNTVSFPVNLFASPNMCVCVCVCPNPLCHRHNLRMNFLGSRNEKKNQKWENRSTLSHTMHSHNIFKNQ